MRVLAKRYDRRSYRQAVVRACDRANRAALKAGGIDTDNKDTPRLVPRWSPLQLRHTAATAIRARFGIEAAKVILGHSRVETSQIYAETDTTKAQRIMEEIGKHHGEWVRPYNRHARLACRDADPSRARGGHRPACRSGTRRERARPRRRSNPRRGGQWGA
jgi:hypothetical protein